MADMKKPMTLAFKTGTDKVRVFQCKQWRASNDFLVTLDGGKPTCTCTRFRFGGKCSHQDVFTKPCEQGIDKGRSFDLEEPLKWLLAEAKDYVIVLDDKVRVVDPSVGNLGAFNLLWLLDKGLDKTEPGNLNAHRIYAELEVSLAKGISVNEDDARLVGKMVKEAGPSKLEKGYDEDLGIDSVGPKAEEYIEEKEVHTSAPVAFLWETVKRPNPEAFYVERDVWEQVVYGITKGLNVLITGSSGAGKTECIYLAAKATGLPIEPLSCGAMSEPRTTLIGNTHFSRDRGTWFDESRFVRAVKKPNGVVLLDEITRAVRGAFNILLPLMDRQRYLALDEAEDAPVIHRGEHVAFCATANTGMEYTGTDAMDKALKDRFDVTIDMTFPPPDNEIQVLLYRCQGLSKGMAKRLVEVATKQRDMTRDDGEFIEMISTRMLIAAGNQIAAGMSFNAACKFCICNQFSNEGGDSSDRTKVFQIVQKKGTADIPF